MRSELTLKAHEISTVEPCNGQESFLAKDSAKKNSEGDGNNTDYIHASIDSFLTSAFPALFLGATTKSHVILVKFTLIFSSARFFLFQFSNLLSTV